MELSSMKERRDVNDAVYGLENQTTYGTKTMESQNSPTLGRT
jgi:hypothetical protein